MFHEVFLTLLGQSGGVFNERGNELQVQPGLPFLHSAEVKILNRHGKLATLYRDLNNFVQKYGTGLSLSPEDVKKKDDIHGLYLRAFCNGLNKILDEYRRDILYLQEEVMKDPSKPLPYLSCHLEDYHLLFTSISSVVEQIISHKAHGCYILDIIHRHSQTGQPALKEKLTRILHVCHGVMYKQLCSWLLYGYIYDPYQEFFIQPSKGVETSESSSQSQEEEEDYLGLMGVTGRQLQKLLQVTVTEASNTAPYLFSVQAGLLPNYIPVRIANKILFVGESIQMFEDHQNKHTATRKGTILKGKEEEFAKELHQLSKEVKFSSLHFESLINKIRTHVAEHLWIMLVEKADLLGNLGIIKDFYLLARGELYLTFIDQAQHLLRVPPSTTTETDVNEAFLQAARNVLFHDETLLQRFSLTVKVPAKPQKRESTSSSSSSSQSNTIETGWNTLGLNYCVQWPLHVFFTPTVLEKYNRVFRFLLVVKRAQMDLHQCWTLQMQNKHKPTNQTESLKWQLRTHMGFLVDNLQYYLQVDVIESQYIILLGKINNTRDYEAVKLAHDQFVSALLSQSFVHMKAVAHCLNEILEQCSSFCALVGRCDTPMSERDSNKMELIAKNLQRQSNLLFKMLSSVRSNSSTPHLAQLLLRLDFNKYFSISGGQFGGT